MPPRSGSKPDHSTAEPQSRRSGRRATPAGKVGPGTTGRATWRSSTQTKAVPERGRGQPSKLMLRVGSSTRSCSARAAGWANLMDDSSSTADRFCGKSSPRPASTRPRAVPAQPGNSSSPTRRTASSRTISSTSTPRSATASTHWPSSSTPPDACTSPASPPTPPETGRCSRPGISPPTSARASTCCASCYATEKTSTPPPSTPSSRARRSTSYKPRPGYRG
ncbi:MAG: hypothetical protein QOD96_7717 [Pseudonocardiales bacterium]|nr:hypothetical protein [Pseudonocardiales bacterium]